MEIKKINNIDLVVFGQNECDKESCEYDCCGEKWDGNRSKTNTSCKKVPYANSQWSSGQ